MADPLAPDLRLPRRRGIEFSLLVVAVLLSVYGYCAVGLAKRGTVPPGAAGYGAGLGVLALLAHLAVRFRAPYADPLLLPIAVLLNGLGLVLIYRLDLETPADHAAPAQLNWSTLGSRSSSRSWSCSGTIASSSATRMSASSARSRSSPCRSSSRP
ncbi:hypothetical protein SAV14893_022140 [Streptomyces avermitilis]|uniref:Cell division protein FtsW n=1 Tax=Streptomyces avermitilis TaxID=33903 RepID=A0A4D4LMM8_STRAX|nr:hypothetical protein SAV14893_022140 [Streptomyces avermitilis]